MPTPPAGTNAVRPLGTVARFSTQKVLRMRVYQYASSHRELVTDNGVTVTDNGEDVWIMVPDA
jgi:hypothetical protein